MMAPYNLQIKSQIKLEQEPASGGIATGFVLGVMAGAAAVVLMGPENRRELSRKAKDKFDELTAGKTIDEVSDSVRRGIRGVIEDIDDARQLGAAEY
ncbi:MAG: YtxH domain-containing protein [Hymenobacter sp.]